MTGEETRALTQQAYLYAGCYCNDQKGQHILNEVQNCNDTNAGAEASARATVCEFANLYRAMRKCSRNVMWKDSVAGYVKNGLANCLHLQEQLNNGTYKIDTYMVFTIFEPKKREIVSTRIKDRVF